MATLLNRVWLCALDLQDWESVAALVHPTNYPSPRLPEDARIASAVSTALVRVAIHEIAGPTFDKATDLDHLQRHQSDTSLPFDQIQHSISRAPGTMAVAVGTGALGIDIAPLAGEDTWKRVRGQAAIKASGAALLGSERELMLDAPGQCQVGGNALWVADIPYGAELAVALASSVASDPVVVRTSARHVLERYREIFDRAAAVGSSESLARVRRIRQG